MNNNVNRFDIVISSSFGQFGTEGKYDILIPLKGLLKKKGGGIGVTVDGEGEVGVNGEGLVAGSEIGRQGPDVG